jgi:protein-disulfide isomerase
MPREEICNEILFDMGVNLKRFLVGSFLILAPVIAVQSVKQTSWGPILAAPKARQMGDPGAKVVIVEYSDFQCPSCAKIQPTLHQFLDIYKGKIRLIYKYYPLTKIHKNAMPAAHAAECAATQDHFWPYHDRLFQTQMSWESLQDPTTSFMAIAQSVNLDVPKFQACYADPSRLAVIEQDAKEAQERQVAATPTFFVGDERLVGQVFATDGARAIEKALRQ